MSSHPLREQLMAFGLGKLEPAVAENIESHLENCPTCCDTLLNLGDDTFADLVRKSSAAAATAQTIAAAPGTAADKNDAAGKTVDLPRELREHGRYEIVRLLGRGGMGDVYLAQHKVMNRPVALKVIKPELVRNDAAVRRFQREVQAAARLHHKHIVTAYDAEQAGNLHFLVMEYVDGVNLDEVVRSRGPLPVAEACDYLRQAAEGLQHAHELGMVHRDIKPHNLMLSSSGVVKILDFGLANFANEVVAEELVAENAAESSELASSRSGASILALTQMGTMMGTPDYIAPEQAKDAHAADIRADIYSLGCTFFTLLTGAAPFGKGSALEKIKAHSEHEVPLLRDVRSDVPEEVEAVVQRMMAKDPKDRYQTPQEVVDALTRLIDERIDERLRRHGIGEPPIPPLPRTVGESGDRPVNIALMLGLTCLILVMIFGGAVYLATNNGTLVVESEDAQVQIAIERDGERIRTVGDERLNESRHRTERVKLRVGEYDLKIINGGGEMALSQNTVVIRRGGEQVVQVRVTGVAGSPAKGSVSNETIAVTLMKDGRYVLNDSPAEDAEEFSKRLKDLLAANPEREVSIQTVEVFGIEPVKQLSALVRAAGAKRVRLPAWVKSEPDPRQPSEFIQSLGDLQAIVRKTLDDEGLSLLKVDAPSDAPASGPRRELFFKAEVMGESERQGKIFDALVDRLRALAKASDAFISSVSQSGQGPLDRYHMSYTTPAREGTIQLERAKLRADKRMPAIWTWTVIVRVEEWPRTDAGTLAGGKIHDHLASLVAVASDGIQDDEFKSWIKAQSPSLVGQKPQVAKMALEWLAQSTDSERQQLLRDGNLTWKSDQLDPSRLKTLESMIQLHLYGRSGMDSASSPPHLATNAKTVARQLDKLEVGFAVIRIPDSQESFISWYVAPRDGGFVSMNFPLVGVTPDLVNRPGGIGDLQTLQTRRIKSIQSKPSPKASKSSPAPLTIGMNEDFGMLFQGQLVAPAELGRQLDEALKENPEREVAIDLPKKKWTVAGHVDQLEQIARIAGAKRITRPAWSEIRIVFGVINGSAQTLVIEGPAYSASGFLESYLPNVREVIAKNPELPVFLDVGKDVDLTDPKVAEGLQEVRRVAEEAGAKVRVGRGIP